MKKPKLKRPKFSLFEKFKRKQKEKQIFKKTVDQQAIETTDSKVKTILKPQIQPVKERKVWRIPGLRKLKRIMTVPLFFLDLLFLWTSLTAGLTMPIAIIFFIGVGFILLDYLWQTKRVKIEVDW